MYHIRQIIRTFIAAIFIVAGFCDQASAEDFDFIISPESEWRFHAKVKSPHKTWKRPSFDDSSWPTGKAGFGYGDGDDNTILGHMEANFDRVQIRHKFELSQIPNALFLYVRYDDAFSAYLNGKIVARSGFRANGWDIYGHEADTIEIFELETDNLVIGENVIALEGFNKSKSSSDFSLHPALASRPDLLQYLSASRAIADLEYLKDRLESQSSYVGISTRPNPISTIKNSVTAINGPVSSQALYGAVQQIIGQLVDGHARVRTIDYFNSTVYIPYSFVDASDGVIAVDTEEGKLVDSEFYIVAAIDDIDIEKWVSLAGRYTPRSSPQLNRRRALRSLRDINHFRADFRLAASKTVEITYKNRTGETRTQVVKLSDERPSTAKIVKSRSRVLDDNIGYLNIPKMDDDFIPTIHRMMKRFKKTNALIIDVRDNSGGRYGIMRAMAGYFLPEDHGPILNNLAKYRLAPIFDYDHLESRPTYRLADPVWTESERTLIEEHVKSFVPEWQPPQDEFSEWHFMLINRDSDRVRGHYYYDKPVVVLSNASSFSATDGFLATFHLFPNSTQIGQPSGGGSGRGRSFLLPQSGIEVRVSSMASFRENGLLWDGRGVEVDIHVEPAATDFTGETDLVLEEAIRFLTRQFSKDN